MPMYSTKEQGIAVWVCQATSEFRNKFNVPLSEFRDLDNRYSILGYLFDNYEYLHYGATHVAATEIAAYLKETGGVNLSEAS